MATKKTNKAKNNKSITSKIKDFKFNGKYLAVTLVFAFTASLVLAPTFAARGGNGNSKKSKQPSSGVYLNSNSSSVKNGGLIAIDVWANSLDMEANAVQAEVSYTTAQFELVDINTTDSAFTIAAQEVAQNGIISIVRGAKPPVIGTSKVATVNLRAITSGGKANISAANSKLLSATTNENIATSNGKLSIRLAK